MELSQETENYIRELIDHSVGLPVSSNTVVDKLHAVEAANSRLRQQYLYLQSKLKEKDEILERARAEASMNAIALKKSVGENQKLAVERNNLLEQSIKWEREYPLYEQERGALIDFAKEVDEKAHEAEFRNQKLVEQNKKLVELLQYFKFRSEAHTVDVPNNDLRIAQALLDSPLTCMFGKNDFITTALGFLEANSGIEVCQKLLKMWNSLRPVTQKVVAMAAEIKNLEKDKDHLKVKIHKVEEEIKVQFEEYKKLDEANKRLISQCCKEMHISVSDGKHTSSSSGKGKQESGPKLSSPLEKKLDSTEPDSQRQPLSPLQPNSPRI